MSDKDFQNFVDNQIKRINEYAKWEEFFNDTLSKKVIRKNKQFNIVDKEWIEKWKEYVGFEEIKEKCKKFSEKENQTMKQEISEFLLKKNAKQKLEELGPLDCSKIKRQNKKFIFFEETSNFLPIESFNFNYFKPKDVIAVNGDFIKGKCFLNNINFAKNENKKIVIIEKNNHNNEIKEAIITLEAKEDIKKVKEELSEKSLEEILNDERFKNKIIEKEIVKKNKSENKEQEIEKPKNEKLANEKPENRGTDNKGQENEIPNKEPENEKSKNKGPKNKEPENEKSKSEKPQNKEIENQKPENEKQDKYSSENKETKNTKPENEKQENKTSENKETKNEKQENEKQENKTSENKEPKIEKQENKNPEKQKQINKEEENKLKKEKENKIIEGMAEIYNYNYKIKEQFSQKDKSFLLKCSVINKEWYKKFLENSNFEFFKEKFEKLNFKNVEEIQNNIRNDINKINFNNLQSLQKDADITSKPLDNIENLAFVSEEFLIKINEFMKGNNNNDNKEKLQNKNVISNNNKQIMIKNGQALLKMNDQKFICFNPQEGNINEVKNQQIVEFPKDKKIDLFKLIENDKKNAGIKNIVNKQIYEVHSKPIDKKINASFNDKIKIKKTIEGQSSLGLDNVGATCYMNATLQCLAHIKKVSEQVINYRENGKFKEDKKKYQLSSVYADVLKGIWFPDNTKAISFAPNEFKNVLGKMNPLFAPTAANDAKDLLIYLIEQMHNELNNSKEENLALIMPDNMDPTNQNQVLTCFVEEFMKKYNSVFSHYFYGSNMSMTRCFGCNITKYSYQCFSFLIFPLLEAKKYCVIAGRIPPFFYNQYILNIEDCFIYNQKIEFFTGDNQMYCNQCRQLMNSSMGTCIYTAPLVLILVLNRGKGNLDFREKFEFWEIIDLTNYVVFKQADNRYFLAGVITHLGESGDSGHFIAFCRMSEISPWFCYNDSMVTQTDFRDINTRGTPYILFYQKIKL